MVLKAAALGAVVFGALVLRIPLLVVQPGPLRDVAKLVQIDAPTHRSKGSYLLTTVLVTDTEGVTLPKAIRTVFDSQKELVSRDSIFPPDSTRGNTDLVHAAQMTESQDAAAVAALHELHIPVTPDGAFVREVAEDSDAAGKLLPGDVIVAVGGRPVTTTADLVGLVEQRRPGRGLRTTVRRLGEVLELDVKTAPSKKTPAKARLGVSVVQNQKLPVRISVNAGDIGGPSAGLVFGLAIYDALSPGDLTRGRLVAGTGTISNEQGHYGRVGAVGGSGEKVVAAGRKGVKLFIAPQDNLKEAERAAPGHMKVIGVSSLHEAILALNKDGGG